MKAEPSHKFLVIRRDNIGDLVCTTPLLNGLRRRFPEAFIGVLVNSYNRDVLRGNPDIDEVYAYTKAKHRQPGESRLHIYANTLRLLMRLRREEFDYAILATPGYQRHALFYARLVGVRHVVGFVGRPGEGGIEVGVLYQDQHELHEVQDVWRLAAPLRIEGAPPPLKVVADPLRAAGLRQAMLRNIKDRSGPLVALHISARKPSQRWPVERFAELARQLHERHRAAFMLLWSPGSERNPRHPGDDENASDLEARMQGLPLHRQPTLELAELIDALSLSDAVVCSDGGAMHIAAALGKPIVCFFGDSQASRWRPWGTRHELLQPASRQATDIPVEEAAAAFGRLLQRDSEILQL
jgi:ADP-heptose:LPS heptosyltransferase